MKTMDFEKIEDRIGRRVGARLLEGCDDLPHDITERLKAARMQAVAKRKVVADLSTSTDINSSYAGIASLYMGDSDNSDNKSSIWMQLGMWLPLVLLLAGLIGIPTVQQEYYVSEIASVDLELLGDDLPPAAYTDPGFVHFLNARSRMTE
jgi:hypothetical protein